MYLSWEDKIKKEDLKKIINFGDNSEIVKRVELKEKKLYELLIEIYDEKDERNRKILTRNIAQIIPESLKAGLLLYVKCIMTIINEKVSEKVWQEDTDKVNDYLNGSVVEFDKKYGKGVEHLLKTINVPMDEKESLMEMIDIISQTKFGMVELDSPDGVIEILEKKDNWSVSKINQTHTLLSCINIEKIESAIKSAYKFNGERYLVNENISSFSKNTKIFKSEFFESQKRYKSDRLMNEKVGLYKKLQEKIIAQYGHIIQRGDGNKADFYRENMFQFNSFLKANNLVQDVLNKGIGADVFIKGIKLSHGNEKMVGVVEKSYVNLAFLAKGEVLLNDFTERKLMQLYNSNKNYLKDFDVVEILNFQDVIKIIFSNEMISISDEQKQMNKYFIYCLFKAFKNELENKNQGIVTDEGFKENINNEVSLIEMKKMTNEITEVANKTKKLKF